jgi:hypothetical protein
VVGAGTNCANHLFRFRGSEDELHVGRWLLNDLEQGIEALSGDHVRFIKDEDFVAVTSGSKNGAFTELSGIVNSVVGGGIDFNDIE